VIISRTIKMRVSKRYEEKLTVKDEKTATKVDSPQIIFTNHFVDNVLRKIDIHD
jgi:hypothetical protein